MSIFLPLRGTTSFCEKVVPVSVFFWLNTLKRITATLTEVIFKSNAICGSLRGWGGKAADFSADTKVRILTPRVRTILVMRPQPLSILTLDKAPLFPPTFSPKKKGAERGFLCLPKKIAGNYKDYVLIYISVRFVVVLTVPEKTPAYNTFLNLVFSSLRG